MNALVQHGATADYADSPVNASATRSRTTSKTTKNGYHKKMSTISHSTLMSKSSTGSSDTEPFYLHPPNVRPAQESIYGQSRRVSTSSPPEIYGIANDGLYINPMRNGVLTPTSPNGSVSGESFYLHDPQEVIYNRVKDLFDSDSGGSHKESSNSVGSSSSCSKTSTSNGIASAPKNASNGHPPNALTVQVEVHSSSSGAGSGSEESLSVSSGSDDVIKRSTTSRSPLASSPASHNSSASGNELVEQHDYEDIYMVREEARIVSKQKYAGGRSRSRDSGSHSRSASASSNHSTEVIVHYGATKIATKMTEITTKSNSDRSTIKNDTYESVCSPEDVAERTKVAQMHPNGNANGGGVFNNGKSDKRVDSKGILFLVTFMTFL